jgi:hypothetical protein
MSLTEYWQNPKIAHFGVNITTGLKNVTTTSENTGRLAS